MNFQGIKRQGYPITGGDDWLLKNATGAAIKAGDLVAVQINADGSIDTAVAISAGNLNTILAVAREACVNDATKSFKACVQGRVKTNIPAGAAKDSLLMPTGAASTTFTAYATDTKAANKASAIVLTDNSAGGAAIPGFVLFDGYRFAGYGQVT